VQSHQFAHSYSAENPSANPSSPRSQKLIRSSATKAFLTPDGSWTNQVQNAARFSKYSEVVAAVRQFQLQGVELYYMFSNEAPTAFDLSFPID